jgi:hypothetical protein
VDSVVCFPMVVGISGHIWSGADCDDGNGDVNANGDGNGVGDGDYYTRST